MVENEPDGSRSEFLARAHRFTDMMLNRLGEGSSGKDVDEKETRMLANVVLKVLRIWEKALHADQPAPQLEESLSQARKKTPAEKKA